MQLMVQPSSAEGGPSTTSSFNAPMRFSGSGRKVRTLIAASVSVALAVSAHVVGTGMAPPVAVLLPVVAAVWAVAYWLAERRIRSWHWLLLLGGTQAVVHVLSSMMGMSHHLAPSIDPTTMTVAHVASTVITAAVLAVGERVWWLILSWIRRMVAAAPRPPTPDESNGWAIVTHDVPIHAQARAGVVGMRAPPAAAAF